MPPTRWWLFFEILKCILVFCEVVLLLALGDRAVFDGSDRTVSDACHAGGTLLSPNRSLIHQLNVVERAMLFAFFAAMQASLTWNAFAVCICLHQKAFNGSANSILCSINGGK